MKSKQELIEELEAQLSKLQQEGPFEARAFNVWNVPEWVKPIRVERDGWSWGFCISETCNHYSHDPYCEGDTVWLMVKHLGDENYETDDGVVFHYVYSPEGHYAPTAKLVQGMP